MNDAIRFYRFNRWCLAPENIEAVGKWLKSWNAPAAVEYRNQIGVFQDKAGKIFGEVMLRDNGPEAERYLAHLDFFNAFDALALAFESQYAQESLLPLMPAPGEDFAKFTESDQIRLWWNQPVSAFLRKIGSRMTREQQLNLSELRRTRDQHSTAADHIATENSTPAFHGKVADLRQKKTTPTDAALIKKQASRVIILGIFFAYIERHGCLPNRRQLGQMVSREVDHTGSQRDSFNRTLREVGLDGLPERPGSGREAGPVRNSSSKSAPKAKRRT